MSQKRQKGEADLIRLGKLMGINASEHGSIKIMAEALKIRPDHLSHWKNRGFSKSGIAKIEAKGYPREKWLIAEEYGVQEEHILPRSDINEGPLSSPGVPKSDSDAPAAEHTQDMGLGLAAVTKEQAAAIRAGITLDEIIQVFSEGNGKTNKIISILLSALADAFAKGKSENRELKDLKESVQEQGRKIQKQESQIEELKSMLDYTGEDLTEIVDGLDQIIKKDTPPEPGNERRTSMVTLAHLLKQAQERINHRGRPETVLEDERLNLTTED